MDGYVPMACIEGVRVSIPGALFDRIERIAEKNGVPADEVVELAVHQFVTRVERHEAG